MLAHYNIHKYISFLAWKISQSHKVHIIDTIKVILTPMDRYIYNAIQFVFPLLHQVISEPIFLSLHVGTIRSRHFFGTISDKIRPSLTFFSIVGGKIRSGLTFSSSYQVGYDPTQLIFIRIR